MANDDPPAADQISCSPLKPEEPDISDRPEPETVVAPLRALLASGAPSGRYRAEELLVQP